MKSFQYILNLCLLYIVLVACNKAFFIDLDENNSESITNERYYSILYPKERFSKLIDLYNEPQPTIEEQEALGIDNWDPIDYTVVGYYFEPQNMFDNIYCLKASTVAYYKDDYTNEMIVDTAILCNTAITIEKFRVLSRDANFQNDSESFFETKVRNRGFEYSDIQFMSDVNYTFRKTFIGLHDLRFISKDAKYISISGCLLNTGELWYYDNQQFGYVEENYFTFKFHGLNSRDLRSVDGNLITSYCSETKEKNNCIDKLEILTPKELAKEVRINQKLNPGALNGKSFLTKFSFVSNPPNNSHLKTPETAFSSPCPPRWDDW